jgi:uncharacterized protein YbjT (DUF2867 family)
LVLGHLKKLGAKEVVAVARNITGETSDAVVKWEAGDVKDEGRLSALLKGASAVLFTASASQGWSLFGTNTPKQVDYEGCVLTAKAAVHAKVPQLVIVSSAFVARPYHPIALMLSTLFGRVMQWKRKGELEAISLTQQAGSVTSYIIVRPGGLSDKKAPKGLQQLQISQGDTVGGMITRDDTALVTAQALLHPTAKNTVFEVVWHKEEKTGESEQQQQQHAPPQRYKDWTDFFSRLRPNNGAHDPAFYPADHGQPTTGTGKAEL